MCYVRHSMLNIYVSTPAFCQSLFHCNCCTYQSNKTETDQLVLCLQQIYSVDSSFTNKSHTIVNTKQQSVDKDKKKKSKSNTTALQPP